SPWPWGPLVGSFWRASRSTCSDGGAEVLLAFCLNLRLRRGLALLLQRLEEALLHHERHDRHHRPQDGPLEPTDGAQSPILGCRPAVHGPSVGTRGPVRNRLSPREEPGAAVARSAPEERGERGERGEAARVAELPEPPPPVERPPRREARA